MEIFLKPRWLRKATDLGSAAPNRKKVGDNCSTGYCRCSLHITAELARSADGAQMLDQQ